MIKAERGSALITAILTAFLCVLAIMPFLSWSSHRNKEVVRQSASSQAQWYADAGIEMAYKKMKAPDLDLWLPPGTTYTLPSIPMNQGMAEVTLTRSLSDSSLVDMQATGYYYLSGGSQLNHGRSALQGRVRVIAKVINVADFMVAKPKGLKIDYGTNVTSGKVYAEDLTFAPRPSGSPITPTRVYEALYYQTCVGTGTADVQLTLPPRRLITPLDLGVADPAMRNLYFLKTQGTGSVPAQTLDVSQPFTGLKAAPPSGAPAVYFANGDLHIGTPTEALTVSGVYTVYVTGSVYIHNSIRLLNSSSWIAIVTEKDLIILDSASPDFVPHSLEFNGNYYANGGWLVRGGARNPGSTLQLNGGMVIHGRIEFSYGWPTETGCTRQYSFARSPDPNLLLPNLTTQLDYRVQH